MGFRFDLLSKHTEYHECPITLLFSNTTPSLLGLADLSTLHVKKEKKRTSSI